jgi:Na+/glutamate symporter
MDTTGWRQIMPQSSYDIDAIAVDAEKYMKQTPEELEYNFKSAWTRVRPSRPLPDRGDDSFWRNTKQRLVKEVIKNETTGSVAIVSVATTVVQWLQSPSNINLNSVDFPVSLFVALITKAAMDELRSRNAKSKQKSATGGKKNQK